MSNVVKFPDDFDLEVGEITCTVSDLHSHFMDKEHLTEVLTVMKNQQGDIWYLTRDNATADDILDLVDEFKMGLLYED